MRFFESVKEAAKHFVSAQFGRKNPDDSFWICDIGEAAYLLQNWSRWMPRVRPYFAMKTAPYPELMKFLLQQGLGIDCASQNEIDAALKTGADPACIILSNTNKQITHLTYAKDKSVTLTVYDCEEELRKIHQHFPEAKLLLRLKLRMLSDDASSMNPRFGSTLETSKELLKLSQELGMNTIGICFHVGAACMDKVIYSNALEDSRVLFDLASDLGLKFEMLDIGGGFFGMQENPNIFKEMATSIGIELDRLFSKECFPGLKIIAEPGRYFASTTFTLLSNVIAKKESKEIIEYTINQGVTTCFFALLTNTNFGERWEPTPLIEETRKTYYRNSRLYGPTCAGYDVVKNIHLPKLEIGEWLLWPNCGAYSFAMNSSFNGFESGVTYPIVTEKYRQLLKEMTGQYVKGILKHETVERSVDVGNNRK